MNVTPTPAELAAQPTSAFSASLAFSHRPPYAPALAERVPILQAFSLALANFHRTEASSRPAAGAKGQRTPSMFRGVECGVFTGSSLLACAAMAKEMGVRFHLLGLDTFRGLPKLSENDLALTPARSKYLRKKLFTETSIEAVREKIRTSGFEEHEVTVKAGLFSVTLPKLPADRSYHFVNIDCDLYEPHLECLEYFYPRVLPGGVVFFDDYHSVEYPMARKAVDDFMASRPETLMHLRFGGDAPNRTKSFFIKY